MNKIMIPLDGSDLAEAAVEVAAKMSDSDTVFVLIQVLNSLLGKPDPEEIDQTRAYLNSFVPQLAMKRAPADIRVLVMDGPVAESLIETAEKEGVGLIVMTTQGSGGLARWLMGSVAERVVRHAPCPVLTVGRRTLERGLLDSE